MSDRDYWSNRKASLIRGEWDDWKTRFQPLEEYYAGLLTDPAQRNELRNTTLGYVQDSANDRYQAGLSSLKRQDNRLGVGLGSLEQNSRDRKMQASKQAMLAKSLTDTTSYMDDREQQMMSGGISSGRTS